MKLSRNQKGFGALEIILLLVTATALAFVGWFVWKQNEVKSTDEKTSSQVENQSETDFETCKKASDSRILMTYPEKCISKDGKTYTSPALTVPSPEQDSN